LGSKYDMVEVPPHRARNHLLLPKLAVYASPENIEKYKDMKPETDEEEQPSSPFARRTAYWLSLRVLNISMNVKKPWKLEPWHVRVAFRKAGIIVPEETITMPSKPIEGPDLSLQHKEFLIKVKINNKEEALVRCRINHTSAIPKERVLSKPYHWLYTAEPLFPEEGPLLEKIAKSNRLTRFPEDEEDDGV
ncbi:54S ribosomal protein L9, mitochondrial, partial [Halocaridina rubra]